MTLLYDHDKILSKLIGFEKKWPKFSTYEIQLNHYMLLTINLIKSA